MRNFEKSELRQKSQDIWNSLDGKSGYNKIRLMWISRFNQRGIANAAILADDLIQDAFKKLITGEINTTEDGTYKERINKYVKDNLKKYIDCQGIIPPREEREQKSIGLGNISDSLETKEENGISIAHHYDTPEHNVLMEEKIKKLLDLKEKFCKKPNSPACKVINSLIYQNNLSDEDLAKALNVEVNTIRKQRSRIREMLMTTNN